MSVVVSCALWCGFPSLGADPKPFFSLDDGIESDSSWLHPGKVDLLFRGTETVQQYNGFAWTPSFKGGAGLIDPRQADSTVYLGGFLRPLAGWPDKGELILGAQSVDGTGRQDVEVQGEYRLPIGWGIGGGHVEAFQAGNDINFGKITWRPHWGDWKFITELQGQSVEDHVSPGGYLAAYNQEFMGVFGHDGEQWRTTLGYVAPTNPGPFRPTLEVLYVDNSVGDFEGPKSVFANATLKFQGGFLSHPARLGRAMGPQGLEFGNPLGFLNPTWNRRLDPWEMGDLADLRFERVWTSPASWRERYELVVFPLQFAGVGGALESVFAGASWVRTPQDDTPAVVVGLRTKLGFLNLAAAVEYPLRLDATTVVIGLIDTF